MTTERKQRTITLTGRAPVKIHDSDWPAIAAASEKTWDNEHEFQANETWHDWIKVRQHQDGRTLVYASSDYSTQYQGRTGHLIKGGELLAPGADIPAAILRVTQEMMDRGANGALGKIAHECIADLPAEAL